MTPLRKQLQQARSAYASARYPGNLAEDVLPGSRGVWRWRLLSLAAAAAAVFLVVLWPRDVAQAPSGPADVQLSAVAADVEEQPSDILWNSFAEVPTMPEIGTLIPSTEDDSIALVPSFPSIEELTSTETTLSEDSR